MLKQHYQSALLQQFGLPVFLRCSMNLWLVQPEFLKQKLWDYLYNEEVLNITILETAAFRLSKQLIKTNLQLKTSDAIIAMTGIEFEAQILTFDKGMHTALQKISYKNIYLCRDQKESDLYEI